MRRWTVDMDAYYVHFQNGYDTYTDPATNEPVAVATGPSNTKGIEVESNVVIGYGLLVRQRLRGFRKISHRSQLPQRGRVGGKYPQ